MKKIYLFLSLLNIPIANLIGVGLSKKAKTLIQKKGPAYLCNISSKQQLITLHAYAKKNKQTLMASSSLKPTSKKHDYHKA